MDGNGRWAKKHNRPRVFGHKNGVTAVREITEGAAELGIKYLTLYAFSTENWNRPRIEVNALMTLLVETLHKEIKTLHDNQIRLEAIGDLSKLPTKTRTVLKEGIENTRHHTRMTLVLALNYSARWELQEAARRIARDAKEGLLRPEDIDDQSFSQFLTTSAFPDPELLIRTSGEFRLSNFLLYQIAYTELYFTSKFWPEFTKEDLCTAIVDFQGRERRFGKTSEQISEL
ncbi:UNVERIFIED_CONTAM: hypothetical protein GTU68_047682 [Idotea baltica]|nr:hypothetical protein [Idotea baltica]